MSFGPKDIVRDQLTASVIQIEREKTMKGSSQSQPCADGERAARSDAEPSAADHPECPFCEEGLEVQRMDGRVVTGYCWKRREIVQVEA